MSFIAGLGDIAHLASFTMLISRIESAQSCVGFSGKMQILQAIAYLTRYWDFIFFDSIYQSILGILWICFSLYNINIIYVKYKKTYEKRCDSFWIESIIITCIALAFCIRISNDDYDGDGDGDDSNEPTPEEISQIFSRFVESVSIIPQLYFYIIKQQKLEAVTRYILCLALYRACYIIQWITEYISINYFNPYIIYPGIIQIFLYGLYFLLPKGKEEELPVHRNVPPQFMTQLSLLETPLLKRTATSSSSIYIIGRDSTHSSLNRSISSDTISNSSNSDGRY